MVEEKDDEEGEGVEGEEVGTAIEEEARSEKNAPEATALTGTRTATGASGSSGSSGGSGHSNGTSSATSPSTTSQRRAAPPPSTGPLLKASAPVANAWAEKAPSLPVSDVPLPRAAGRAVSDSAAEGAGGGEVSFMSVQRGRRKGKNASSTASTTPAYPQPSQKSFPRPSGGISLLDAIPAPPAPAPPPAAKNTTSAVTPSSTAPPPRYADAVLRSAPASSNSHGGTHMTTSSSRSREISPSSTQDFPPLSATMMGTSAATAGTATTSTAATPQTGKKPLRSVPKPSPAAVSQGVALSTSVGSGGSRHVPKGKLPPDTKKAPMTPSTSSMPSHPPPPSAQPIVATTTGGKGGNSRQAGTAISSFSYAAVAAAAQPAPSNEPPPAISPPVMTITPPLPPQSAPRADNPAQSSFSLGLSRIDATPRGGENGSSHDDLNILGSSLSQLPVLDQAAATPSVNTLNVGAEAGNTLDLQQALGGLSLTHIGARRETGDMHGNSFDMSGDSADFPAGLSSNLIMFGDINVPVSSSGGSIPSLPMGGGLDPSYVPYGGYSDGSRNMSQSRLMQSMDGDSFDDPYQSAETDDQDILHTLHAEMLLGDDDDDVVDSCREAADLVEFLQETGSIVALAERLGFRKSQSN